MKQIAILALILTTCTALAGPWPVVVKKRSAGTPFDPSTFSWTDISGCILIWDARGATNVQSVGAQVTNVIDNSGTGHNAYFTQGNYLPSFTTNAINGRSALSFAGDNSFLQFSDISVTSITAIVVWHRADNDSYGWPLTARQGVGGANNAPFCYYPTAAANPSNPLVGFISGYRSGAGTISTGVLFTITSVSGGNDNSSIFRMNGTNISLGSVSSYGFATTLGRLGGPNSYSHKGLVGLVVLYNHQITQSQSQDIEAYITSTNGWF